MAKFRMVHQSDNRAVVTRLGHKMMGTSLNGWNIGVDVNARKLDDGCVEFEVWQNGGSNNTNKEKLLAKISDCAHKMAKAKERERIARLYETGDVQRARGSL